jgi:hypothetical protein
MIVLADVDHMQHPRLALEDLPHHRLADGPGAADDQKAPGRHPLREQGRVARQVGVKQRLIPADQLQDIEHRWLPD